MSFSLEIQRSWTNGSVLSGAEDMIPPQALRLGQNVRLDRVRGLIVSRPGMTQLTSAPIDGARPHVLLHTKLYGASADWGYVQVAGSDGALYRTDDELADVRWGSMLASPLSHHTLRDELGGWLHASLEILDWRGDCPQRQRHAVCALGHHGAHRTAQCVLDGRQHGRGRRQYLAWLPCQRRSCRRIRPGRFISIRTPPACIRPITVISGVGRMTARAGNDHLVDSTRNLDEPGHRPWLVCAGLARRCAHGHAVFWTDFCHLYASTGVSWRAWADTSGTPATPTRSSPTWPSGRCSTRRIRRPEAVPRRWKIAARIFKPWACKSACTCSI